MDHLSRKPVAMFGHPLGKERYPHVKSERSLLKR